MVPARTLLTLRDPFLPPFLGPCCLQGWTAPPRDISLRNPPFSSPREQQHGQPRTNEVNATGSREDERGRERRLEVRRGEGVLQGRGEWEFEKGRKERDKRALAATFLACTVSRVSPKELHFLTCSALVFPLSLCKPSIPSISRSREEFFQPYTFPCIRFSVEPFPFRFQR